jgi:hypothetical protein
MRKAYSKVDRAACSIGVVPDGESVFNRVEQLLALTAMRLPAADWYVMRSNAA